MSESVSFITGEPLTNPGPLARYLPPLPQGVVGYWLAEHVPPGSWILDPFGAASHLPVEAARAGYRVLVASNNPITRFMLELAAIPPSEEELRAALAELAATRKGDERLEPHIQSLYHTRCEQCRQEVTAESFLWERGSPTPYARIYHCPHCGDYGERPITTEDSSRASSFATGGLHRARALERVTTPTDPDRAHVEEALSVYLPRAIYALFTIINKFDSLTAFPNKSSQIPGRKRQILAGLILSALDQANTLWPHPTGRARPRQLTVPPRFRENNVWLAMEEAVSQEASSGQAIPLSYWPARSPKHGGVTVYEGRLRDLLPTLSDIPIASVLGALPRPNQAFWTLSALWAGWLWGREAVGPFKSVLRRRRYDWAWHSNALHAAFSSLGSSLQKGTPFLGLIGEAEPGFLSAGLISAEAAGFTLQGLALRAETGQVQIHWEFGKRRNVFIISKPQRSEAVPKQKESAAANRNDQVIELAAQAGRRLLKMRAEPATYIYLHTAAVSALAQDMSVEIAGAPSPADLYNHVQEALEDAFTYRQGFLRYGGSEKSLEVGQWWMRDSEEIEMENIPLSDRVESFLASYLYNHHGCTLLELDKALCKLFTGLLTPDSELVQICLKSYGEPITDGDLRWRMRNQDQPENRHADLSAMRKALETIAFRLNFLPSGENPLLWLEQDGRLALVFYLIVSASFGKIVFTNQYPHDRSLIVLPGGRASVASYKLRHNARLNQFISGGWRFLKFRHVRRLLEIPQLTRQNLDEQFALDPLLDDAPQMRLL